MNDKILIIIIALVIFTIFNIFIKLLGLSFVAKKYGIKTQGIIIGYYAYYDLKNLFWYPVVKINDNGEDIIVQSKTLMVFPIYNINEIVNVKYYSNGKYNKVNKTINTDRLTLHKEEVQIDVNSRINIIDIKHNLDIIIELVIIIILLFIKI